jgi:oligopeptidase A
MNHKLQPDGINPLLDFSGLARFGEIEPAHVTPAVDRLLLEAHDAVIRVTASGVAASWETVVEPLNEAIDRLGRAWGTVSHLNAVVDTLELREQYNENLPKLTAFWTELSQNEALYGQF